jgi:hypothetical protein
MKVICILKKYLDLKDNNTFRGDLKLVVPNKHTLLPHPERSDKQFHMVLLTPEVKDIMQPSRHQDKQMLYSTESQVFQDILGRIRE